MNKQQIRQFNAMLATLRNISKNYQSPDQLRRTSKKNYGLDFEEALEMSYENIQSEAAQATKGVKAIKSD